MTNSSYETIGCLIMASGLGKRFGGCKLTALFHGKPMIRYILEVTSACSRRVVVTRNEQVKNLCDEEGIPCILHTLPGRNDTVRLGTEYLLSHYPTLTGLVFCPADQPLLTKETFHTILDTGLDLGGIVRPSFEEVPGAPVFFSSDFFPDLLSLPEGKGGGFLAQKNPEQVHYCPVRNFYELKDIDTVSDLETLEQL